MIDPFKFTGLLSGGLAAIPMGANSTARSRIEKPVSSNSGCTASPWRGTPRRFSQNKTNLIEFGRFAAARRARR